MVSSRACLCSPYKGSVHPSLSASLYHSNKWPLIDVDEDNDLIYSLSTFYFQHLLFFCYLFFCFFLHYHKVHPFSPSSFLSAFSSCPHCQVDAIWRPQLLVFFPLQPSHESASRTWMHVCMCLCLCESMHVISSGLAALTWLGEFVSILLARGAVEALLTLSTLITL